MCGLYHLLRQFRMRQPGRAVARRVVIDVGNPSVVNVFNHGRAKNPETHAFSMQLFELQVEHGVRLSSKWTSTAENEVMDVIWRPSRKTIVRIAPALVQAVWDEISPSEIDLVACTASVLRSHSRGDRRIGARRFDRSGHHSPGLRVLFPTADHGRTQCATPGGRQGPRDCPFA